MRRNWPWAIVIVVMIGCFVGYVSWLSEKETGEKAGRAATKTPATKAAMPAPATSTPVAASPAAGTGTAPTAPVPARTRKVTKKVVVEVKAEDGTVISSKEVEVELDAPVITEEVVREVVKKVPVIPDTYTVNVTHVHKGKVTCELVPKGPVSVKVGDMSVTHKVTGHFTGEFRAILKETLDPKNPGLPKRIDLYRLYRHPAKKPILYQRKAGASANVEKAFEDAANEAGYGNIVDLDLASYQMTLHKGNVLPVTVRERELILATELYPLRTEAEVEAAIDALLRFLGLPAIH